LTDLANTETARRLYTTAAELADLFGARAAAHEAAGTFPFENYDDLRRSGYHLATVPEKYGGWGASVAEVTRAQARLGEGCASTALVVAMQVTQVARAVQAGWPPATLDRVMSGIVEHGYLINSTASEPATGSPSRGGLPTTTATPISGGYRITGRKTYSTGAPVLHYFVVSAAIPVQDGEKPQVANFLVERDQSGVSIATTWNALALRLCGNDDLLLDGVELTEAARLNSPRKPTPQEAAYNAAWALPVAAVYFGIGRAEAKYAARYARERKPNSLNKSIAELAHIQEKAGRMELALLEAENTLFAVADLAASGEAEANPARLTALVGAAKLLATNRAMEAVDLAMRIVGSASLSLEAPLQRYYRDVRAGLGNPPMDDVSTLTLGKLALGLL
jgi:alkylation response protein AidB-like acyl-CoA dehydrogenase